MQKLYRLVQAITFAVLLIPQQSLQAQNCCLDCQADVKVITNSKVLLEKIDLKEGTSTTLNTNLYVSYRSGNAQKFWANLAIATAGVAISTQLNSTPITAGDSKTQSAISPIVPLGVSVATLPGIWKNRPRGVPDTKIEIQHKDVEGNVLKTWTQAISKSARNDAELLNIALSEPLSKGTVEISLVNESKNSVYYWGYEEIKQVIENQNSIFKTPDVLNLPTNSEPKIALKQADSKGLFSLSYSLPKKEEDIYYSLKRPKTPIWISNDGGCPGGEHIGSDGNCQPDGPALNEVTITPPPPPPPPPAPWVPTNDPTSDPNNNGNNGNTNGNGTYNNSGGGGSSSNPDPNCLQNLNNCRQNAINKRDSRLRIARAALFTGIFAVAKNALSTFVSINESAIWANLLGPEATAVVEAIAIFGAVGVLGFEAWALEQVYWGARGEIEADYNTETLSCNTTYNCR